MSLRSRDCRSRSVVSVYGTVEEEPRASHGVEIRHAKVEVISPVTDVLPFELNKKKLKPTLDVFLNNAPVGLRYPSRQATFRLYSDLLFGFRDYLDRRDFVEIHTPKMVGAATEGGANVFQLDYFGRPAYLAQSPQLYKQIMVGVFERVFEVGPAFRAEEHYTVRHLNEYNSLDVEMAFIDSFHEVMDLLIELLEHMVRTAMERHPRDAELAGMTMPRFGEVPRIKFREAQRMILERYGEDRSKDLDLSPRTSAGSANGHRRSSIRTSSSSRTIPTAKRAFYTLPDPEDPEHSLSFDLIFQGQELVSGSQRVHRLRPTAADHGTTRHEPRIVRRIPPGVQVRYAARGRLRHRLRALADAAGRRGKHSRDHALSTRRQPSRPVASHDRHRSLSAWRSPRSAAR